MLLQSLASCIRTVRLRGSLSCVKMAVGILALTSQITNWIAPPGKSQELSFLIYKMPFRDFPGGAVVKNRPANAGDMGSSPGPGRSHTSQSN